jgi:quercetin dioxygenase-like cupin family protein
MYLAEFLQQTAYPLTRCEADCMKSKNCKLTEGFRVAFEHGGVQAAEMVIAPGDKEGGPRNRHPGADQWLFVVAGTGAAIVEGSRHRLRRGSLLLTEKGRKRGRDRSVAAFARMARPTSIRPVFRPVENVQEVFACD